jgi:hypothetical protein
MSLVHKIVYVYIKIAVNTSICQAITMTGANSGIVGPQIIHFGKSSRWEKSIKNIKLSMKINIYLE